eukprot:6197369-Pleurochrysis_carterae.AAC.1
MSHRSSSERDGSRRQPLQAEVDAHALLLLLREEISRKRVEVQVLEVNAYERQCELVEMRKLVQENADPSDTSVAVQAVVKTLEAQHSNMQVEIQKRLAKLQAAELAYEEKKRCLESIEVSFCKSSRRSSRSPGPSPNRSRRSARDSSQSHFDFVRSQSTETKLDHCSSISLRSISDCSESSSSLKPAPPPTPAPLPPMSSSRSREESVLNKFIFYVNVTASRITGFFKGFRSQQSHRIA